MIDPSTPPSATAAVEDHADFLELSALRSAERRVSAAEFIRDLDLAGATETAGDSEDDEQGQEMEAQPEPIAEAVFAELGDRRRHCGAGQRAYPFRVTENTVELDDEADSTLYVFLALLSWFGKDAAGRRLKGEKIFEEVCAKAAEMYLGGPGDRVRSFVFGFPRRNRPRGFAEALDLLCREMGEGEGHHPDRENLAGQKDAQLDLAAWRHFADERKGKLVLFGQCATGNDWESKRTELNVSSWCGWWMRESPAVLPVRSFFVPHRVASIKWTYSNTLGGILYDRCRIASLASEGDRDAENDWREWSAHVLRKIRNS